MIMLSCSSLPTAVFVLSLYFIVWSNNCGGAVAVEESSSEHTTSPASLSSPPLASSPLLCKIHNIGCDSKTNDDNNNNNKNNNQRLPASPLLCQIHGIGCGKEPINIPSKTDKDASASFTSSSPVTSTSTTSSSSIDHWNEIIADYEVRLADLRARVWYRRLVETPLMLIDDAVSRLLFGNEKQNRTALRPIVITCLSFFCGFVGVTVFISILLLLNELYTSHQRFEKSNLRDRTVGIIEKEMSLFRTRERCLWLVSILPVLLYIFATIMSIECLVENWKSLTGVSFVLHFIPGVSSVTSTPIAWMWSLFSFFHLTSIFVLKTNIKEFFCWSSAASETCYNDLEKLAKDVEATIHRLEMAEFGVKDSVRLLLES
eukprot:PhM_4_TR6092/c0_g1_i1/m.22475